LAGRVVSHLGEDGRTIAHPARVFVGVVVVAVFAFNMVAIL